MVAEPGCFRELEATIDGVCASYTESLAINQRETSRLPSKRAVTEAFEHLRHALFLGFYAEGTLTEANLRHRLAEHLYVAYEQLVAQIDRAVAYAHLTRSGACALATGAGEEIVLGLFRQLPALRRTFDADVRAAFDGDPAASSVEEIVYSYPSLEAIVAYRVAHWLCNAGVPLVPRMLTEYAHSRTGIDIHPGAQIGERFFIDHGTGVVIGETAVIGHDVKLYQGVTLGALSVPDRHSRSKRHPTLEDGVTVYAGATILGGDTVIGAGSIIGGNVWLTSSVAPGSRVFGRSRDA